MERVTNSRHQDACPVSRFGFSHKRESASLITSKNVPAGHQISANTYKNRLRKVLFFLSSKIYHYFLPEANLYLFPPYYARTYNHEYTPSCASFHRRRRSRFPQRLS